MTEIAIAKADRITFPEAPVALLYKHVPKADNMRAFATAIMEQLGRLDGEIPLAVYNPDTKQVRVYPNIMITLSNMASGYLGADYEPHFRTMFYSQIATDIFSKRWENPEGFLARVEETTVPRYLRRIANIDKDDVLRDMAQKIESRLAPPELIYAKEPKDYLEAYNFNSGSCMQVGSSYIGNEPLQEKAVKACIWPSQWFMYSTQFAVVYIRHNGKAICRSVLSKAKLDGPFAYYANPYSASPEFRTTMRDELARKGLVQNNFPLLETIEVPCWEGYLPWATCDSLNICSLYGVYMSKRNSVLLGPKHMLPKGAVTIMSTGAYNKGFIPVGRFSIYDGDNYRKEA